MNAEIFAIGTELLMGELTDTNAAWLAARLPALGIQLQGIRLIGDSLPRLTEAFTSALQRVDLILTTGGLGPTQDDLTREAIAATLQETPTVQEEALKTLESYFLQRGRSMPPTNIKQAHLIPSAQFLPNRNGTAPGWWAARHGKIIIAMPGPPVEMHAIWDEQIEPRLRQISTGEVTLTRNIKTLGLSEAEVDATVAEFFGRENPYLGIYSKADGIHLRLIARARDVSAAQALITPVEAAIVTRLSPYLWGYDDDTPERAVGKLLTVHGWTLATIDCCTGGYLANSITEVPESVAYFKGGVVAYSQEMLMTAGVPTDVIQQHGMISQASATAMAQSVRRRLGADFGIAVAGAPGPAAVAGQPAGLAYLAIASASGVQEHELRVPPRRVTIKRRIANTALIALCRLLRSRTGDGVQSGA